MVITKNEFLSLILHGISTKELEQYDYSSITDMNHMFYVLWLFVIDYYSFFDTSNVTDMSYMFTRCTSLKSTLLLNTSNVTNNTFSGCVNLSEIDYCWMCVYDFDTSFSTLRSNCPEYFV